MSLAAKLDEKDQILVSCLYVYKRTASYARKVDVTTEVLWISNQIKTNLSKVGIFYIKINYYKCHKNENNIIGN